MVKGAKANMAKASYAVSSIEIKALNIIMARKKQISSIITRHQHM